MATYQFSALADGQTISFNPSVDVLNFDQTAIAAADVVVSPVGADLRISVGAKDVLLTNVSSLQLATTNITFADASRLLFGDNTAGTANDNAANSLTGTAGRDHLAGFGGADTLNGGAGNDVYVVGTGDVISDSSGNDTVLSDISWSLGTGLENLTLTGTANISAQGNSLNNLLQGNSGGNYFNGRAGNDTILAGNGNDTIDMSTGGTQLQGNDSIDGGSGTDTLDYDGYALSAVIADLAAGQVTGGGNAGEGSASISSIERFVGGAFNDRITGNFTNNYLDGRSGNDTIDGGTSNDTLIGGAGADNFVFSTAPDLSNADQVTDFVSGTDKLVLDGAAHTASGPSGTFVAGDARFWSSTSGAAHDADDRVIYNTSSGQLWYDADGNGSGAAQLIATLQGASILAATDITVENGTTPGSVINGTGGDDSLTGTAGDDSINGLGGNDTIRGVDGSDTLVGGDGNDSLEGQGDSVSHGGNPGADLLIGGAGDDTLDGALSETQFEAFTADTLDGGLGNDVFHVDGGGDTLIDAGGVDTVAAHQLDGWTLADGYENLQLFDSEGQSSMFGIGNAANNVIEAVQVRHARIEGLGGNDLLIGTSSEDTLLGGDGNDTIRGIENGFDSIDGGAGDDLISGVGNLAGGAGNDTLNGGIDGGTLAGGTGLDVFVYDQALPFSINPFSIGDFASGSDTIRLDALALPALGASGRMAAGDGRFFAAPGATSGQDADDRVVFNTTTQELFYDADGSGSQAAGRLFTLQPGATLAATDIEIINGSAPSGGTINGTAGNDSLTGTAGDDTINGLSGNDYLEGGDGQDSVVGGNGNDTLWGNDPEHAILYDGEVPDTLDGGFGDDVYHVRGNDWDRFDTIVLDPGGIDTVHAHQTSWTLGVNLENLVFHDYRGSSFHGTGNELDNFLDGGGADYVELHGMGGNDTLVAGYGGGTLYGGDGNDALWGNYEHGGYWYGGAGNDTLGGRDHLDGGDGNDSLSGSDFEDTLDGGNGIDTMAGGGRDDIYYVTAGDIVAEDTDSGVDTVNAYASWTLGNNFEDLTLLAGGVTANGNNLANVLRGNDANNSSINGRAGNDTMFGMGGNDVFDMSTGGTSSYGTDVIDGGAGTDSVEFGANARSAVNVNLTAGTVSGGGDGGVGSASLTSVEGALGGNFNDTLTGNSGANLLRGSNGNDTLNGKAGVDVLNGGAGNDAFVFDMLGSANRDIVQDFATGVDKLQMENSVMTAIGATGNFAAGDARFWAAAGVTSGHDANDRIVYNSTTGDLYYDADGSGAGAAQFVSNISGHPVLAATDIAVI